MSNARMMDVGESYISQHTLDSLDRRRGKVLLEVKRAFTPRGCAVSVYGWSGAQGFVKWGSTVSARVVLMRVILASSTPKDEIRTCMKSLLVLTLQRLGTSEYHLRTKMRV